VKLPFEPMLLTPGAAAFADAGWLYQVKWDGVRNLTLVEGGVARHWSRRLRERTHLYPEFGGLASVFGGKRAVLDGEIIVQRGGKPSFAGVLERDVAGSLNLRKAAATPATLMLFDLLEYGDRELYSLPLGQRLEMLASVVSKADAWEVVTSFPGAAGPDLFRACMAQELEGVVAKRLGSAYQVGVRSRDWVKIKRKQQMLAVVCGYTAPVGRSGGLLLGAYAGERLVYIGRAGSGISSADLATIRASLAPAPCPFGKEPSLRDRFAGPPGPVVWVEPRLTVHVQFTEWTEEGRLRDPVVVGFATAPAREASMPVHQ